MKEITVVNVISVQKGRGHEVAERFAKPKAIHTFPGFVKMEVWIKEENIEESDELHICTTWLDKTYFTEWRDSRLNQKVHEQAVEEEKHTPSTNSILGASLSTYHILYKHLPESEENLTER